MMDLMKDLFLTALAGAVFLVLAFVLFSMVLAVYGLIGFVGMTLGNVL